MSKLRWQRNDQGGVTLEKLSMQMGEHCWWTGVADVFKAKRGDRYVVRLVTWSKNHNRRYHQYAAFSLREAMRMAKFLVGVQHDQ
jgi:hypothetical protein